MTLAKKITTAAALVAALLAGTAPKAAAQCPYTVGPLGRYIAPAIVQGMTATDDGAVEVWCTVPAVGVPASRLALAVLHPVRFCRLPEGSDSPLYRVVL